MTHPYPELQSRLEKGVDEFLAGLPTSPEGLYQPIGYILGLGGKRIRPVLTMIAADLFGLVSNDTVRAAVALELFHNFSLIHDDIMDQAPLRRGKPTVHQKWNLPTAILSGDVLLIKVYELLSRIDDHDKIMKIFNRMAAEVCEGQQMDLLFETKQTGVSVAQYKKMISLKTAALLSACVEIGALIAGANENDQKLMAAFGLNLGVAFQLQDDLLDVYGEAEKFGKQRGGDIIANKKTFLHLKAIEMSNLNSYKKEELEQWVSFNPADDSQIEQKVSAVTEIYDFFDIKSVTTREIMAYHNMALKQLEELSAQADKKNKLADFATSMLKRQS